MICYYFPVYEVVSNVMHSYITVDIVISVLSGIDGIIQ